MLRIKITSLGVRKRQRVVKILITYISNYIAIDQNLSQITGYWNTYISDAIINIILVKYIISIYRGSMG